LECAIAWLPARFQPVPYRRVACLDPIAILVVRAQLIYDLYDRPESVAVAADRLGAFFGEHL